MTWMRMWASGFPLYLASAHGAQLSDLDGNHFIDFCLGDTGAMAGHSPLAVQTAVARRYADLGGATTMLPTEDAAWVARELARRFGPARWSFTLAATDANRWAIRLARQLTARPKILAFSYCYHGSVAAVLMEPALTNIGIVLPEPGYLGQVRALTRQHGTLLINNETRTFSAGPGGRTRAWGLQPDIVTIGKSIAGGIPAGAYGLSADLAEAIMSDPDADIIDTGGVGGTLAANALSVAAMRATLEKVLTDAAFGAMIGLADRYTAGVRHVLDSRGLPWNIVQLGARASTDSARRRRAPAGSPTPRLMSWSNSPNDLREAN